MNSQLQVVAERDFNGIKFECYQEKGQQGCYDFWATREQIGQLLGYENPRKAIKDIHARNKERLNKFSDVVKLSYPIRGAQNEPPSSNQQSTTVYNFKGLLEICRYSQQPNANRVIDVLWEIADEIRRTGSYNVKMNESEIELKREALNLEKAKFIQSILLNPPFPMTDETKTVFGHEAFKLVSGHDYLAMLPESTEKWYTAGEIGEIVGVTANMIGRIAKNNGLKAPEGESNEYGHWIFSKSRYSNREVTSFMYSEAGLDWFRNYYDLQKEA